VDINECARGAVLCQNGAVCMESASSDGLISPGNYMCDCADGWDGRNCEMDVDECASMPCAPNGVCSDLIGGYSCRCSIGWTGTVATW